MDTILTTMQKEAVMKIFIKDIIEPRVKTIRESLANEYDISEGCFKDYTGLCNTASEDFCNQMNEYFSKYPDLSKELLCSVGSIHGEQKHLPRIKSSLWPIQHTWCYVKFARMIVYVDITSQQFKEIYNDIPDYYISKKKPKWFYPDRDNPAWHKFFGIPRWINNNIFIKHRIVDYDNSSRVVKDGLIEYIQYEIWGRISDKIHHQISK